MIVRKAERYDLPGVLEMIEDFQDEGLEEYALGHTVDSSKAAATMFIQHQIGVVAIKDDKVIGCLGGFITPFYLNEKAIVFQEILWYVRKSERRTGAGIKMLYKVMEVAKDQGATHIVMAHTGTVLSEKISRIYERLGFKVLETQYIRGL